MPNDREAGSSLVRVSSLLKDALDKDLSQAVDLNIYSDGEICESCGRHIANDLAWEEVPGGGGTNLCWGDCDNEFIQLSMKFEEVVELYLLIQLYLKKGIKGVNNA